MLAFSISCIAIILLAAGIIYFGIKTKEYNHIKHTISELGETGSSYEKTVSYGLFLPTGILLCIAGLLSKHNANTAGLALVLAAGYIIAAFFPCDPGSPSSGSWKQQVHNIGGFIEYAGSIYFIMKMANDDAALWFIPYKTIGILLVAGIVLISIPNNPVRGLVQRVMETLLFSCLLQQFYMG
ncbi:MAG: DUF998 domain-containing protein [Ferruginibacter sp.]